jgi:HEAT repeat protein
LRTPKKPDRPTRLAAGRTTCVVCLVLIGTSGSPAVRAQVQSAPSTQELINQLIDPDAQKVRAAAEALMRQSSQVVPALLEALDTRQECQMQFVASAVLRKFEPNHSRIEGTLAKLVRGECTGASQQDVVFKQDSAFALSYTASGLALLIEMLPHKDLLTRRRVAFAFEDLTEKMNSPFEEFRPPAAIVEPTARALPKLAPFLDDRDEVLRCVTLEALQQASESKHASIAAAGKSVLAGKKVDCSRKGT